VYIVVCIHPIPKVEPKGWEDNAFKITLAYIYIERYKKYI
jgi:hypothetical protein